MRTPSHFAVLIFLFLWSGKTASAQNFVTPPEKPPVSFHLHYKYSFSNQRSFFLLPAVDYLLQRYGFFYPIPAEHFDNLRSSLIWDFPVKTHLISAGAGYDIFRYLQGRMSLGYRFGKNPWVSTYGSLTPNSSPQIKYQKRQNFRSFTFHPEIAIDLLFKDPDDALNILVGGNIANFKLVRDYKLTEPNNERLFSWARSGWYFNWNLGLEWQDYIGKHFGYSLGFIYTPAFDFSPSKFEVAELIINGEHQTKEEGEKEYADGFEGYQDGKIGRESIPVKNFYQVQIGLKYRL